MKMISCIAAAGWLALASASSALAAETLKLTIAEALERARAESPRLAQLGALEQAAAARRDVAKTTAKPSVDLSGAYARLSHVPEFAVALPGEGRTVLYPDLPDTFQSRAAFNQPLYTGGRATSLTTAATHELGAAQQDVRAGDADLELETTVAYWSLVTARARVRVVAEAIASYEAHLVDARNRQRVGLAATSEVLAVQVQRDQAQLDSLVADHGAQVAEADLQRLLGEPPDVTIEPTDDLAAVPPPPATLEELVEKARSARPERAALEERARAADARADAAETSLHPQVMFSAGYDFSNPNRRFFPPEKSWRTSWDAGVSATWTVFDSGRTKAAAAQSRAEAVAARAALVDLDRRIQLEVKERWLDLATAAAAVETMAQSVLSAEENRRVSQERYRAGVSPSSELLDAETALLRANLALTEARARRQIARAGLDRAVGK